MATPFLVIGGLRYMTAAGDPGAVEQAKGSFKAALTGYALAVLAPVILDVLQGILAALRDMPLNSGVPVAPRSSWSRCANTHDRAAPGRSSSPCPSSASTSSTWNTSVTYPTGSRA
jgi:hypothetical protein